MHTRFLNINLLCLLCFLISCKTEQFPGYTPGGQGIHYKLVEIGENTQKPAPGDFITADIQYKTMDDSVFFNARRKIQIEEPSYKGSIDACFLMLSENDKSEFILPAYPHFVIALNSQLPSFLDSSSYFKVEVLALDFQSAEEYAKEKEAFLAWIDGYNEYEQVLLKQYLEYAHMDIEENEEGFYKIISREGTGESIEQGDTVIVHYEGRFLNGQYFDSTIKRKEAFGLVYGTEWQVLEGMEKAIGTMKEGEKALFIIPSELAWGKKGSSTGIIPPYTSVIYDVEVVEVK